MRTELDELLIKALESEGDTAAVNPFYAAFLRTSLYLPTRKNWQATTEKPFQPLMSDLNGNVFLLVFDTLSRLEIWIGDNHDEINHVEIIGHDLVDALGHHVYLGLNYETPYYKEFSPNEIARLKTVVEKTKPPKKI